MKTNRSRQTGGILVIVMVIVVTLSLMIAALLNLGKFNSFETERQLKLTKARWIAEAGFEVAAAKIRANAQTLSNVPDEMDGDFDGGRYEVAIERENLGLGRTRFTITSTGKVNDVLSGVVEAAVKVEMRGAPGVDQSIIALSGTSELAKGSTRIDGDIYVNGDLDADGVKANAIIRQKAGINGVVELGGDDSTSNHEGDEATIIDDLNLPALDRKQYTDLLEYASNTNNIGVMNGDKKSSELVYVGNTASVRGSIELDSDIPAGKTIVATGGVKNTSPHTTINLGATIVAGDSVEFKNQVTLAAQTLVFTLSDIIFDTSGNAGSPSTADGTTLLAMGSITTKNIDFNGIIYAEEKVYITSGSDISGTVIAGTGFDVAAGVTVAYDPSVFANPNPLPFLTWVLTERRQWQESPF